MSVNPVSAPTRTASPEPARGTDRSSGNHDAKALADEFAAAARRGALPLGGREARPMTDGKGVKLPVDLDAAAGDPAAAAKALARHAEPRSTGGQSEVRRDDSQAAMLHLQANGPGLATPMQAPPPVAAHVDPAVFADMLTRLWTREQGRTAREVRVSFGDGAWPATGARLLRLDDGSLQVTVSMGQHGGDIGGGLEALRERLTARGLNVADIAYEDA